MINFERVNQRAILNISKINFCTSVTLASRSLLRVMIVSIIMSESVLNQVTLRHLFLSRLSCWIFLGLEDALWISFRPLSHVYWTLSFLQWYWVLKVLHWMRLLLQVNFQLWLQNVRFCCVTHLWKRQAKSKLCWAVDGFINSGFFYLSSNVWRIHWQRRSVFKVACLKLIGRFRPLFPRIVSPTLKLPYQIELIFFLFIFSWIVCNQKTVFTKIVSNRLLSFLTTLIIPFLPLDWCVNGSFHSWHIVLKTVNDVFVIVQFFKLMKFLG